jgi:hypothetical protein
MTGADPAEASIQTDIVVRSRRRRRMRGTMGRKAAKRTYFPTMATMNHPLPLLHAELPNTNETLAGETSPVTNPPNFLTNTQAESPPI